MRSNIIIIGCMGTGKTTVGKLLSKKTGMTFIDMDDIIEKDAKMSIKEIFSNFGEEKFRDIESKILIEVLKNENSIISCGGGVIIRPDNVSILTKRDNVILLTASPKIISKRLSKDDTRPLLENINKELKINSLLSDRSPLYISVAKIVIDTTDLEPEEVADEILERIR